MLIQPRGPIYLRELDTTTLAIIGAGFQICPDALSIDFKTTSWEHENKCGTVDVVDKRGANAVGADITLSFANLSDMTFAMASLGTINAEAGTTSAVVNEPLLSGLVAGDYAFLGGKERHRNITLATFADTGSPGGALTANTDYSLDAETGLVKLLTTPDGDVTVSYTHQDPTSVSLLTAPLKQYALDVEYIDRANANKKGSLELYAISFDPATGLNYMPDKNQDLTLKGSCLADLSRDADSEFGQIGRRVLRSALA